MGDFQPERLFDFAFVQHRVGRAGGLGREFRRAAGADAAFVVPGGGGDLRGEVVPRRHALVREVVEALVPGEIAAFDDREDRHGQVPGVGRGPRLVEDHVQTLLFGRQPEHRFQEVVPVFGIEPRRAEGQVFAPRLRDGPLPGEFRAPVDAQRCGRGVFRVGQVCRAVEDVVRRDVDQRRAVRLRGPGEVLRRPAVQPVGRLLVLLGALHVGVGRAVHDHFGAGLRHGLPDGPGVGDVEFRHVGKGVVVGRHGAQPLYFTAQLAVGARYEYVHGLSYSKSSGASASCGCRRSFSERSISPAGSRQSIASAGSSHAMPPSLPGA